MSKIKETNACMDGLFRMIKNGHFYSNCLKTVQDNIVDLQEIGEDVSDYKKSLEEFENLYNQLKGSIKELDHLYAIYEFCYPDKEYQQIRSILKSKDLEGMLSLFSESVEIPRLIGSSKQVDWAEKIRIDIIAEFFEAIAVPDVSSDDCSDMEEYLEKENRVQWMMEKRAMNFLRTWTDSQDYIKRRGYGLYGIRKLLQTGKLS